MSKTHDAMKIFEVYTLGFFNKFSEKNYHEIVTLHVKTGLYATELSQSSRFTVATIKINKEYNTR